MDLNTISAVARPRGRSGLPAWQEGDAFLAGGTWLFSEPQPRLSRLIDLAGLGWEPLRVTRAGPRNRRYLQDRATRCRRTADGLARRTADQPVCPAFLASFKIWNMATVGGNLCMSLPAGPMISLAGALDGLCTIWNADGGERTIPAVDFVKAPLKNALSSGDLLRLIELPASTLTRRTAFRQISLSPLGRSGALSIGTLAAEGTFTLTVTASTPRPFQFSFPKVPSAAELRARVEHKLPPAAYYDDIHGTPAWRRHMTLHFAEEIRRELSGDRA